MKRSAFLSLGAGCAAILAAAPPAFCKPPASAKEPVKKPAPAALPIPSTDPTAGVAIAHWLSGAEAIVLPFGDVVQACAGKTVVPFDPANPADAAALSKIGAALDALLPRMNRPDDATHSAAVTANDLGPVAARFADELAAALPPPNAAGKPVAVVGKGYPELVLVDPAAGKAYYLAVALYPTGGDPRATALNFQPGQDAARFQTDGCCLLVGIEHNGKAGRDLAFLNWQVIDLARLQVHFTPAFRADQQEAMRPAAVLTDGRKGRD